DPLGDSAPLVLSASDPPQGGLDLLRVRFQAVSTCGAAVLLAQLHDRAARNVDNRALLGGRHFDFTARFLKRFFQGTRCCCRALGARLPPAGDAETKDLFLVYFDRMRLSTVGGMGVPRRSCLAQVVA